uniref:BESS domain-containing protein n=2 Tax=Bactrocera latifrons TaxID=174628 RepID=A0A0K8U0M3_BACLA
MEFFKPFMLHNDRYDGDQDTIRNKAKKRNYDGRLNDYQTHIVKNNLKSRTKLDISKEMYVRSLQFDKTQSPSNEIKGEIDEIDDEDYQAIASAVSDYGNTSGGWDELMDEPDNEEILYNSTTKSITSVDQDKYIDPLGGRYFDGIDLTFLGYASSIKKLSPRRQSIIKFAVAKLIMREELAQQNDNENHYLHNATT